VNMIAIRPNLQKYEFVSTADVETNSLQNQVYILVNHQTTVFSRTCHMVQKKRDAVTLADVLAHTATS
jgi:hypothetical protein